MLLEHCKELPADDQLIAKIHNDYCTYHLDGSDIRKRPDTLAGGRRRQMANALV
jgi:hypothetical protein